MSAGSEAGDPKYFKFDYRGLGHCLGRDPQDKDVQVFDLGDEWPAQSSFDPSTHHGIHLRQGLAFDNYCPICTGRAR
jgi:hypothetical protein